MNFFGALLLLAPLALALPAQENCPSIQPTQCGKRQMFCEGGMSMDGCPLPGFCISKRGKLQSALKTLIFRISLYMQKS